MKELVELFKCFFRIGGSTFGGGHALLSLLKREVVTVKKWASEEEVFDSFALGQMTPGIVAVNTATLVGYRKRGVPGAIATTLGLAFPALIIFTAIAAILKYFGDFAVVKHAFAGIRVAVAVLILDAVVKLYKGIRRDRASLYICAVVFLFSVVFRASPALLVLSAGLAGFLLFDWWPKIRQKGTK